MTQPSGKAQLGSSALGSGSLQVALQKQRNLQQRVDSDLNSLVENFSNMVAACKIQDQVRNTQEAFQIDVHVARITQVAESLLDIVNELKQSAFFSNFEERNNQVAANSAKYEAMAASDEGEIQRIQLEIENAYSNLQNAGHEFSDQRNEWQTARDTD